MPRALRASHASAFDELCHVRRARGTICANCYQIATTRPCSKRRWIMKARSSAGIVGALGGSKESTMASTDPRAQTGARPTAPQTFVEIETTYGKIRGVDNDGIKAFRGIPYGASTAGKNRFMPPAPPAAWTGVRETLKFGQVAPQPSADAVTEYGRMIGWDKQPGGMGEDCLVLNVWTPGLADGRKRAVMFSIHGGGFTTGSAGTPGYNGDSLARFGDVVVVTINHRLGALGYLHLADLGAPPEFALAGAAGMLDIVAALAWVRDNIERFGGDPGAVTAFGQSGGGAKTSTLMAMPGAAGLFARAGVQSGSALRLLTRELASELAERLLRKLGIAKNDFAALQAVPFEKVIAAQSELTADAPAAGFAPVVDGEAIPRHPFHPDAPAISADVPMIIGTTLDDSAMGGRFDIDEAGVKAGLQKRYAAHVDRIFDTYRRKYPTVSPFLLQARMLTDRRGRRAANTMADLKAAAGKAPAYLYLWSWPSPALGGKLGAVHGVDVGMTFNNARGAIAGDSPEARALAARFAAAWVAFAKTGDPNTDVNPRWPAYDSQTRPTMVWDSEVTLEHDPLRELRTLWDDLRAAR
jgi:para-nitrobenzyl esterase